MNPYTFNQNTLGGRLQFARTERRWTQKQAAKSTGCSSAAISHFETGGRTPSVENLKKLCVGLGVSADYLLWGI